MQLNGITYEDLGPYESLNYDLSLIGLDSMNDNSEVTYYKCNSGPSCNFRMSRQYTPILYYIVPSVLYEGADISFYLDPKSA